MYSWRRFVRALTRAPRGYLADGKPMGVGLAAALAADRSGDVSDIENYLRRHAREQRTPLR